MHTADIGFLHTVAQVLDFKGIGKVFTHGWCRDFVTGTKKYHYKNAVTLAVIRAKATDRESFMMYFEILEDTLIKNECTYITVTKLVFL